MNVCQSYVGSVKIPNGNFIYKLFRKRCAQLIYECQEQYVFNIIYAPCSKYVSTCLTGMSRLT